MIKAFAVFLVALPAVMGVQNALAADTRGAIQLPSTYVRRVGKITCGYVKNSWIPGRSVSGAFLSHKAAARVAKADAKKTKGKARAAIQRRAQQLLKRAANEDGACGSLPPPYVPGGLPVAQVKVNISGARGFALGAALSPYSVVQASGAPQSNLRKLTAAGALEDVVTSGKLSIAKIYVAPNDKLYAVLSMKVNLETGQYDYQNGCLLVEISAGVEAPVCVDNALDQILWPNREITPPIQFDQTGAVYYLGMKFGQSGAATILRRYSGGQLYSLITDNNSISSFLVLGDGTVILSGMTNSSQAYWVREFSNSGATRNLLTSQTAGWIHLFPDGNAYFGLNSFSTGTYGIRRYLADTRSVDDKYWSAAAWPGSDIETYFNAWTLCQEHPEFNYGYCQSSGASITSIHHTVSGKVYAIAGYNADGNLMRYFPDVAFVPTVVSKAAVAEGILNHVALFGLDGANENRLVLHDTADDSEIDLFAGTGCSNIEVYRMSYSSSDNNLRFDGQRFADSKYVLCAIDMGALSCNCSPTGDTKLEDFQGAW